METNHREATRAPEDASSQADAIAPKAAWHAPTMEQVDYSATEAFGSGGVYDLVVYTGSV
ncbi:MAG TPA: hypothetical protein VF549_04335 [Solirubrobacteraceae bacterium]|jgi:hypothetical protein